MIAARAVFVSNTHQTAIAKASGLTAGQISGCWRRSREYNVLKYVENERESRQAQGRPTKEQQANKSDSGESDFPKSDNRP